MRVEPTVFSEFAWYHRRAEKHRFTLSFESHLNPVRHENRILHLPFPLEVGHCHLRSPAGCALTRFRVHNKLQADLELWQVAGSLAEVAKGLTDAANYS